MADASHVIWLVQQMTFSTLEFSFALCGPRRSQRSSSSCLIWPIIFFPSSRVPVDFTHRKPEARCTHRFSLWNRLCHSNFTGLNVKHDWNLTLSAITGSRGAETACFPMDADSRQIQRSGICLCVFCGLPGAGKSTLARTLSCYTQNKGWGIFILSYDDIIPDDAFELKGENASFTDTQSSWKLYRQEVLQCLDAFVRNGDAPEHATWAKRGEWDTWARFSRSVEEQQVLKTSKHSRPQMSHLTSEPLVVLLDDNFYYPSMRYEVYQLARKYSLGFCQLYLQCPLNACLTRNRMRRCPLPDEVIVEMAKRIEPPNPRKNQWEQNSLTLTSTFSYPQQDIELLIQMIGEALEKPLSPIQDNAEQKEADRQCCATSILHQADQACRRLVSQAMKDAKEFKWGEINMKSLAAELKQLKTKFLEDLRKQAIQGYPICPGETVNVDLVVSRAVAVFEQQKDDLIRKHIAEPVKPP